MKYSDSISWLSTENLDIIGSKNLETKSVPVELKTTELNTKTDQSGSSLEVMLAGSVCYVSIADSRRTPAPTIYIKRISGSETIL